MTLYNNNYSKEAASHKDSCTVGRKCVLLLLLIQDIRHQNGSFKIDHYCSFDRSKSNFLVTTKEGGFTQACSKVKDVTKICKISQCALYKQPSFIGGFGGGDGLVNHNVSFCELIFYTIKEKKNVK